MSGYVDAGTLTREEREKLVNEINTETERTSSEDNLIVVTQLPIIEQQLISIKERFTTEAGRARALECNEDTLKSVRETRANITKVFNALEAKRKEAKRAIMSPYDAFEEIYKSCVTDIYKPCDKELADKIHEVEDSLKAEKRKIAEEYFSEYCKAANIDFLTFDRVGLNIGLSTTKKAIRDKISAFVAKVAEELLLIDTYENSAEVLVEYKQSLNVAQAAMTVINRHKAMAAEQERLEIKRAKDAEMAAAAERVEEVAEAVQPPVEETSELAPPIAAEQSERVYELTFTVRGTMVQLKALKAFLNDNGYDVWNGDGDSE